MKALPSPLLRPSGLPLAALAGLMAVLVLRPPVFPVLTDAWSLLELWGDRAGRRARVEALRARNAALAGDLKRLGKSDPFVTERLARESGFLRAREFDYREVGRSLALPPCPPAPAGPQ